MEYDHYISLDWSQEVMCLARLGRKSTKATVVEKASNLKELRAYLDKWAGRKVFTFEESTPAQWLYTELRESVDRLIVCNPLRNKLLSEGAKNDRIDAVKLCELLRAGLLKEVYHSGDKWLEIRKLTSAYTDLIKSGVRMKNQLSSLYRAQGMSSGKISELRSESGRFVAEHLEDQIALYQEKRKIYQKKFKEIGLKEDVTQRLQTIPGFGPILAVRFASTVVEPRRFATSSSFLSYCGLVRLEKVSGGKIYGRKRPIYHRPMKGVIKSATITALMGKNPVRDYYERLIKEKNYPTHIARHATARKLALTGLSMMKNKENFDREKMLRDS